MTKLIRYKIKDTHQYTQHYYGFPVRVLFHTNLMKGACGVPSRAIGRLLATSIIENNRALN